MKSGRVSDQRSGPVAFEDLREIREMGISLQNYAYFMDKMRTRLFVDDDDAIQQSYSCAEFGLKCASLEDPSLVHDGALGLVVDDALGYHAIHYQKGICVTRSLSVHIDQSVPLGAIVVCRCWTSRKDGNKIFIDGDVIDAKNHSIRYARASGLFFKMPENVIKWPGKAGELPYDVFEKRISETADEWDKTTLANRAEEHIPVSFPTMRVHCSQGMEVPLVAFDPCKSTLRGAEPFEFVGANRAIKLEIFQTAMTIEGLCFFSNRAMGPNSAHGGSILTCFVQFFKSAMRVLYPGGDDLRLANITVSYIKQTPLEAVAKLTRFSIAEVDKNQIMAYVSLESEAIQPKVVYCNAQVRFERIAPTGTASL